MAKREDRKERGAPVGWAFLLYALILAAFVILALDGRHVRFYLSGAAEMELAQGTAYEEPGCVAVSAGRLFGEGRRTLPLEISGEVDGDTLGDYEICYRASLRQRSYETRRTVRVVDRRPPEILLERREGYAPTWFTGYEEEGYRALDDNDGDITGRVEREVLDEQIIYRVRDSAGNLCEVTRQIPFSVGKPVISLQGGEELVIPRALTYAEPGFSAADSRGNDLSGYIRVSGDEVDPRRTGEYERVYTIDNGIGGVVSVTRQIRVVPAALPEQIMPEKPTIYLTFDDGPGPYTGRLLDILAKYGVKATFFVTCRYPDYFDAVGRAFREGHTIGVHTASHNYYEIYSGEEAFLADFIACEEMIFAQTGSYSRLFRFPGGSSNTVSRFNEGIMTRLVEEMHGFGYQYFDWNVDSDDAGRTRETEAVLENLEIGCSGLHACVVLQHDIKDYSVAAVERFIRWGLDNGYCFEPLSLSSPTAQHGLAN